MPRLATPPLSDFHDDLVNTAFPDLEALLSLYAGSVYPTHPIVDTDKLRQCFDARQSDQLAAAFVYASAAACLNCTAVVPDMEDAGRLDLLTRLVDTSISCLGPQPAIAAVSILRIMTCVFLANCLNALDKSTAAFIYLREAVSMVETFRLESGRRTAGPDVAQKHRLYWLLFIHERYQCISEYRTTVLRPLPDLPAYHPPLSEEISFGFNRVIKLFELLDADFLDAWLGREDVGKVDAEWVRAKCDQFRNDEQQAQEDERYLTTALSVDLMITRVWLSTLLWRIAMSRQILSETLLDVLPLDSPFGVSHLLRQSMDRIPHQVIESHGVGIVQKLFELTDTLADVILHLPTTGSVDLKQSVDDLTHLQQTIAASDRLDPVRRGILDGKLQRIRATFGS